MQVFLSLLTAAVTGICAGVQPAVYAAAADAPAAEQTAPDTVSTEDILLLRDFLLGKGCPEGRTVPDMDADGKINAKDLTLAKRSILDSYLLTDLQADIPDILLNEETVVTFTVCAQTPGLPEKTVALWEPDGDVPAAYMHDDGKNGDQTANDGIYSAQLTLVSDDF